MATAAAPPSAPDLTLAASTAAVLHAARAVLGESPVHDPRTGAVYYVDIEGRAVWALPAGLGSGGGDAAAAAQPFSVATPRPVGGVTPTSDPTRLLVSQPDAVHLLDLNTRTLGPPLAAIPPSHALEGTRFNDGLASPQGTWVGGRLHRDWRAGRRARVYALVWEEADEAGGGDAAQAGAPPPKKAALKAVLEEGEVGMANGMAWAENGTVFYLADSAAKCVLRFEADPGTGVPVSGTGRVAVSTAVLGGAVPDGLCADGRGRLWVALAETGTVGVFAPDPETGGARVGTLGGLPFTRLTSCAWGAGEGGQGVLLVTSREEKGEGASPVAGALAAVAGTGGRGSGDGCGVVRLP